MIITVQPARNVHFCACGRRLLRSEFLKMKHIKKIVRGRTQNVNQLVVDGLKECHICESAHKKGGR